MEIEKYLSSNGVLPNLKGFDLIVEAIKLIRQDNSYKFSITTKLYPKLSEIFKESTTRVERLIRYSIEKAGYNYTNSEFITIAEVESRSVKKYKK